jgi:hypothetical protein
MRGALALIFLALATTTLAAPPEWSIELTTSGGFDGRGSGGLTVTSRGESMGELTVVRRDGKSCHFTITGSEKGTINQLLRSATPGKWVASYALASNPEGCCDQIRTTLKLSDGKTTYTTYWFNRSGPMPADLTAIARRLFGDDPASLRSHYLPKCTP